LPLQVARRALKYCAAGARAARSKNRLK
jgi:hypothetical protein